MVETHFSFPPRIGTRFGGRVPAAFAGFVQSLRGHRLTFRRKIILSGLFGSRVLDAALGLAGVYLLLALFCSAANEWVATLLAARSDMLEKAIARLLGEMSKEFYRHPLIQGLMHEGQHPERLPASTFAKAIIDLATPGVSSGICFGDFERGVAAEIPPGRLRSSLLGIIHGCEARIESVQTALENWFDGSMSELSRRYKRRAQLCTTVIAIGVTIATDADTVRLARALLSGNDTNAALGWDGAPRIWPQTFVGWLLTVGAISLGAPFWFDVARNLSTAARPRGGRTD